MCYLPVCLALVNYRNPEADQHPWHILESEVALIRYFGNFVCMPIGAFFAPGLLGHLVMVFCTPLQFRNHIKCVFFSTILCILLNTSFTARLLMGSPLSRGWVLRVVGLLDSISGSIVSLVNFGARFPIPVLYPCQLWWCMLSIFQGVVSSFVVWLRELRARAKFIEERMLWNRNQIILEFQKEGSLICSHGLKQVVSPEVFCILASLSICLAFSTVWETCKVAMWELSESGLDHYLSVNESWESLVPEWHSLGVLQEQS